MRPRHWKQVLRLAKPGGPVHLLGRGGSVDPGTLEDLTLGQLLGLGLHSELDRGCNIHVASSRPPKNRLFWEISE